MNKKNKSVLKLILLLVFTLLIISISQAILNPCDGDTTQSTCGSLISETGYGAVELCENCFVCGASDGICPAWYSSGETYNNDFPINVTVKKGNIDRLLASEQATKVHESAEAACNSIGGTVDSIMHRATREDEWDYVTGPIPADEYIKARCINVPKTPSCDECIDVDCVTELNGLVYTDYGSGYIEIKNATIILGSDKSHFDTSIERRNQSNANGEYKIENAYQGNVEITCLAEGFKPLTRMVKLVPGNNIVDCKMEQDVCTSDCYYEASGICSSNCDGYNGCEFPDPEGPDGEWDVKTACHNRPHGFFYTFDAGSQVVNGLIEITGADCCAGNIRSKNISAFAPESNNIRNLITRSYNKIFSDGKPGELKILIYEKD